MPCVLQINPVKIFHTFSPIILGVKVVEGELKVGQWIMSRNTYIVLGRVENIERGEENKDDFVKQKAIRGECVSVSIKMYPEHQRGSLVDLIGNRNIDIVDVPRFNEHFYCTDMLVDV